LLDIIAQRTKRGVVGGDVYINGQPINQSFARITAYAGATG